MANDNREHEEMVIHVYPNGDQVAMSVADSKKQTRMDHVNKIVAARREHLMTNIGYNHGTNRAQALREIEEQLQELRRVLLSSGVQQ